MRHGTHGGLRFAIASVALASAFALLATGAGAVIPTTEDLGNANGMEYFSVGMPLGASGVAGTGIDCADQNSGVGGGVAISGQPGQARITQSGPILTGIDPRADGWQGGARNLSIASESTSFFAICRTDALNTLHGRTNEAFDLEPNRQHEFRLRCGSGDVVVGGGVLAEDSSYIVTSSFFDSSDADSAPDDGWRVRIVNDGDTGQFPNAYAICDSASAYAYVRTPAKDVDPGQGAKLRAACPDGTAVASGGGTASRKSVWLNSTKPVRAQGVTTGPPSGGWTTRFFNNGTRKATVRAVAVCRLGT